MLGVTGPNEYENNVNNNWYTNKMAIWCLTYTQKAINYLQTTNSNRLSEIFEKVNFKPEKEIRNNFV